MAKPRKKICCPLLYPFEVITEETILPTVSLLHDNAIVLILDGITLIPYPELKCPTLTLLFATIGLISNRQFLNTSTGSSLTRRSIVNLSSGFTVIRHIMPASHIAKQDCSSSTRCRTNVMVRGYREMHELPWEGV